MDMNSLLKDSLSLYFQHLIIVMNLIIMVNINIFSFFIINLFIFIKI